MLLSPCRDSISDISVEERSLIGVVWAPDPSGCMRKGLGNNLARKCLAGIPRFLNPANFIFRSSK